MRPDTARLLAVTLAAGLLLATGLVGWWLWNWLMPLLGLPKLGVLQFFGLAVLLQILLPGAGFRSTRQ